MSYNHIELIGRTGKDPEIKMMNTASGQLKMARFSLAVSKKRGTEEKTLWLNCQAWGATADICEKFVRKGELLHVCGELEVNEHEGKTFVNVNIRQVTLINPKKSEPEKTPQQATLELQAPATAPGSFDGLPF